MKRQVTTTVLLVFITAASIMALSACGTKTAPLQGGSVNNTNQSVNGSNGGGAVVEPDSATPDKKKEEISVFYTDDQMIDLHAQKTEIEYGDEAEKLTAAFAALKHDSVDGVASLWKDVELLSAKQDGDAVTLDIHLPDEAKLGAPGEALALDALTKTYFQFPGIASLNVLVDGEAVDSLMGHEDLEHPIKKQ